MKTSGGFIFLTGSVAGLLIDSGGGARARATVMFNIFNHTNPIGVNTTSTSTLFGQGASACDPRLVQLGLKVYF